MSTTSTEDDSSFTEFCDLLFCVISSRPAVLLPTCVVPTSGVGCHLNTTPVEGMREMERTWSRNCSKTVVGERALEPHSGRKTAQESQEQCVAPSGASRCLLQMERHCLDGYGFRLWTLAVFLKLKTEVVCHQNSYLT